MNDREDRASEPAGREKRLVMAGKAVSIGVWKQQRGYAQDDAGRAGADFGCCRESILTRKVQRKQERKDEGEQDKQPSLY